jgi:hypothetical protein
MPEETGATSITSIASVLGWLVGAAGVAYLLSWLLFWVLQRVGRRSGIVRDIAELTRKPTSAMLMVSAADGAVQGHIDAAGTWPPWADRLLHIAVIATITWLISSLVQVAERRVIARFGGGHDQVADADRQRRRVRTQAMTLRRLAVAIVVALGAAAAIMTFPGFQQIGTTLFASAGVLSVVAGLAAQTALGSVFAGLQITFSGAIRVGDVVVLEGQWGRIEEITLTYVVLQIWDKRRLVLPTTYFTTTPFENWTRNETQLLGTVELDVDFTVPVDAMRAEVNRLLADNDLWDRRASAVYVTDAVGGHLRVRITVSAPNSGALFDLRCAVREGVVDWLQRSVPGALPQRRLQPSFTPGGPGDGSNSGVTATDPRRERDR